MKKYFDKISDKRGVSLLLELLFLLLPFGSYILSFSIGFMTIYPSLVIVASLTVIGLTKLKKLSFHKIEKYTLIFFSIWLLYALLYFPFVGGKANAVIDIRSLILMLFNTFSLFWTSNYLGFKNWKKIVLTGVKTYFFLLLIFAFLEFQIGIHFQGNFTNKLLELAPSLTHYAPLYLFDNPNNFAAIFTLLGILILILSRYHRENNYALAFISTTIYFVANMSDARLGKLTAIILIIYSTIVIVSKKLNKNYKIYLTLVFSILLIFSQPKYLGPMWKPHAVKAEPIDKEEGLNSIEVRTNLFYNSLEALESSSYLGIGPGQFREYSITNKFKKNTSTVINPHSWMFEIFSQYGVLILLGYSFIFVLLLKIFKENIKKHTKEILFLFIAIICFGISSFSPSSFLIVEMNWIFLAILITTSANIETDGK